MPTTVIIATRKEPMRKYLIKLLLSSIFLLSFTISLVAQTQQQLIGQQFRLAEGIIRIAEPGQIADSINVWGDVGITGRYIVPRGTNLTDLISYARGPQRGTTGETIFDQTRFRVEIVISRMSDNGEEEKYAFLYSYTDPLPAEMRNFPIKNGDLIYIQRRRRATFRDYVGVIAPTLTLILNAILLYDRATRSNN